MNRLHLKLCTAEVALHLIYVYLTQAEEPMVSFYILNKCQKKRKNGSIWFTDKTNTVYSTCETLLPYVGPLAMELRTAGGNDNPLTSLFL